MTILPSLIHILVAMIIGSHLAFSQQPCPGGDATGTNISKSTRHQCWYGGCFPVGTVQSKDRPKRRCAYSRWFCPATEQYVTAKELYELGEQPCTCEGQFEEWPLLCLSVVRFALPVTYRPPPVDILDYPATVGMCDFSGGIITPMVDRNENCPRDLGNPVCPSRSYPNLMEYNYYTLGDPTGRIGPAFTACDLPCSANFGQRRGFVDGEFEGCQYPGTNEKF